MERRLAGLLCYFLTEEQKNIRPREWRGDLRVSYVFSDRRTVETGGRRLGSRIIAFRQEYDLCFLSEFMRGC